MEALLLVLIASSRNVESSTGSVAGSNGKPFPRLCRRQMPKTFPPFSEPENVSLVLFVISRRGRPTPDMRRNQINLIIIVGYDYGIVKCFAFRCMDSFVGSTFIRRCETTRDWVRSDDIRRLSILIYEREAQTDFMSWDWELHNVWWCIKWKLFWFGFLLPNWSFNSNLLKI